MEQILRSAQEHALQWTQEYGYHAVIPALLADPGGVPWAWVFLMLLANEAGKNIFIMIAYGFIVMTLVDYVFYWMAIKGGRPLLKRVEQRWPKLAQNIETAETVVRDKGLWAVMFGRFLPFLGRFVGVGAGLANIPFAQFVIFDALGVSLTVAGFGLVAHFVGRQIVDAPWFPQAVGGAFIVGTVLTLLLTAWQVLRSRVLRKN